MAVSFYTKLCLHDTQCQQHTTMSPMRSFYHSSPQIPLVQFFPVHRNPFLLPNSPFSIKATAFQNLFKSSTDNYFITFLIHDFIHVHILSSTFGPRSGRGKKNTSELGIKATIFLWLMVQAPCLLTKNEVCNAPVTYAHIASA